MKSSSYILRQTAAEILSMALVELFPGTQLAGGGATENGFYCDFSSKQPIDDQGLILLEEKMRGIIKSDQEFRFVDMMRENAAQLLIHHGQPIKAEIVLADSQNIVSILQMGSFYDYNPSEYTPTTAEAGFISLVEVKSISMQLPEGDFLSIKRILGFVSTDKSHLKQLVKQRKAVLKRDFDQINKELRLFYIDDNISACACNWLPAGFDFKERLIAFWKEELINRNFSFINTPSLVKEDFLEKCGYLSHSERSLSIEPYILGGESYCVPPSLTPSHIAVYLQQAHKGATGVIRYAEWGKVLPSINSPFFTGVNPGQFIELDAAHSFCQIDQLEGELISSLQFIEKIIKMFGFGYYWCFAESKDNTTKLAGQRALLDCIARVINQVGPDICRNEIDPTAPGPVIFARMIDSYGREWIGPSVAVDVKAGAYLRRQSKQPHDSASGVYVVSLSMFRSVERWVTLMMEHTKGCFTFDKLGM